MKVISDLAAAALLTCVTIALSAQDTDAPPDTSLEDVLSGFDDSPRSVAANDRHASTPGALELGGSMSLSSVYNYAHDGPRRGQTDYRGLSRLRGELDLRIDARLPQEWKVRAGGRALYDAVYRVRGRDEYPDRVVDAYETEVEPTEVYLQGSLRDDLDVKIGRQLVVWGKSDNIRVTDILNPLDRREPGMVDIEDLRLPVGMTRIDYYFGRWDLTAVLIHEARFSKRPVFGSEYSSPTPPPPEKEPADSFENTQFAAALSGTLGDWDVALYLADVYDDRRHTETRGAPARVLRHSRVRMLGSAVNVAKGNWLVKAEAACFDRVRYSIPVDAPKTRYDVLAGLEYRGISETAISLEAANRHVGRFDDRMAEPPDRAREDEFQSALRLTRDFFHDKLRVHYLVSLFGVDGNGGGFHRFWAEYDLTDSLEVTAGVVDYRSGDRPPFDTIADNDRVFLGLRGAF